LPFSAAIALCPLEAPGRSSCREKNTPTPQLYGGLLCVPHPSKSKNAHYDFRSLLTLIGLVSKPIFAKPNPQLLLPSPSAARSFAVKDMIKVDKKRVFLWFDLMTGFILRCGLKA
jgi:hypothetical protein